MPLGSAVVVAAGAPGGTVEPWISVGGAGAGAGVAESTGAGVLLGVSFAMTRILYR